ncbi:MAG: MtnX-like HAD-IB family phosphatase [Betaproteobacteria bacterium]|nr:MtnX-like HAD-IB family phosphatase [Betaproteobacteria bacterium]
MWSSLCKLVLVFDFDNTITIGDMLDELIEKYSANDDWKVWEAAWIAGDLPARDCLRLQIENLRVRREALLEHLASTRIDPSFARIVDWARPRQVDVIIVSDSFLPFIRQILGNNAIEGVPVFANDLEFAGERLIPSFPFHDPAFPRSANAKARHLVPFRDHTIIFAGDGRSDLDAALTSDIVFAKDSLAKELEARSIPFHPFGTLEPILAFLEARQKDAAQAKKGSIAEIP